MQKIDWKRLISLPKWQRDLEMKKMAKKEKEKNETKRTNSKLGNKQIR